jgi:hypothetical protein
MTFLPMWLACLCCLIACFVTSVVCYYHWLQTKVPYWFVFYENNNIHSRESCRWMRCGVILMKNGYCWWFWTLSGARWFSWSLRLVYLDTFHRWVLWFTCACPSNRFTSTDLASLLPASLGLYQVMTNPYGAYAPHQVCVWACLWWTGSLDPLEVLVIPCSSSWMICFVDEELCWLIWSTGPSLLAHGCSWLMSPWFTAWFGLVGMDELDECEATVPGKFIPIYLLLCYL